MAENSAAGTNVGAAVTATDGNNDTLTYSLEGTDAASFQIVSASGQIQTRSGVTYDYETKSSYSVTVKADDGLGGTDTIAVAIDLTDVNEPPPAINNVALTSDPGADETYAIGDTVTATVTFDRAVAVTGTPQLTLRVGGGDPVNLKPANYASGSGTTTLRFTYIVQMDDEDTNGIYLEADELELNGGTIKGDSDGLDATLTYIRLGEQSDQKVDGVRPTPTAAAVPQNGGTLTVTFTETLSSTTAGTGPFAVTAAGAARPVSSVAASGSTVTLTLASAIAAGQAVSVTYTDPSAGNDTNAVQDAVGNDAATFTRTVTNNSTVVSAAPDFGADTATREVAENSPAGTDVGAAVTATDVDPLTYTLGGTDAGSFQIVSTSGQIRTRAGRTYNHEAKDTYAVTVTADDNKEGTDTIAVTITVTDEDEQPARPARPRVSEAAGDPPSLEVRWSAPGLNGGPVITDYDVQYREGDDRDWIVWPHQGTGTSTTISGLTADPAAYQVQVRADNDELQSEWSPPGRIRTTPPPPPVGPPSPPRGLTATAGDRAVELSWRRPVDDGGARIVRYEYRQQEGDGPVGAWQIIWEDRPTTDHRVTGLMNAVSYTFHVRAVNNGGWASSPSEPASATPVPELEPFEVDILGVPDVAVAGESYELTAQSDAEEALVYAWRVAYGGTIEPDDAQMVVWTAPETAVVAWIRVDATREEDGATAGQSAYVRVELPDPDDPEPVPALPLLGHLLLALGLTGAGARLLSRRPRVPPAA